MQKLSPLMKGLAETRARADASLQNALNSVAHRTQYLAQVTATFENKARRLQSSINSAQQSADEALRVRQACDQLIQQIKNHINPNLIQPINAWQGKYGHRGALGKHVQKFVEDAYPCEVTTEQVAQAIQQHYGLTFETPAERKEWRRVSIRGRLTYLSRIGLIERLHDLDAKKIGRWRAIPTNHKNHDLIALANQADIPLTFYSGESSAENTTEEDDLPR